MTSVARILVFNAGSSSLKVGLFTADAEPLAVWQEHWKEGPPVAVGAMVEALLADVDLSSVIAAGHRVVHGGSRFTHAVVIDAAVRAEIEALAALAPLHNRLALAIVDAAAVILPGVPQVAAFDTAFHATLPSEAYLYGLPYAWYAEWGIRRFGFHGLSHAYCAARCAEVLDRPLAELRLVTCHLGSGCSLAAIAGGKSIATTMGYTPLDGVVMATRPGALDPGILTHVLSQTGMSGAALESVLYHESGLKGVSGVSGDMREVLAARAAGDKRASLAFDLFIARLRDGIAVMAASLGGLDALVFSGGVGENCPEVRAAACERLGWIGVSLDSAANDTGPPDRVISVPHARVHALIIRTREEEMVARETANALRNHAQALAERGG